MRNHARRGQPDRRGTARRRHGPDVVVALGLVAALISGCGSDVVPTPAGPTATHPSVSSSPSANQSPSPTPASATLSATPPASLAPSAGAPTPAAWFEDTFDTAQGWVAPDSTRLEGAVDNGAFVLRPHPAGEPAYIWAPKDGAVGSAVVEAKLTFPASGQATAGLAVADLDFGLRLVLLLGPGGDWRLQRDDSTALRTLASGRIAVGDPGTPTQLRLVLHDGAATAWAGNQVLGRAQVAIDVGHAGLAALAPADGERVLVDDFRVTLPATARTPAAASRPV